MNSFIFKHTKNFKMKRNLLLFASCFSLLSITVNAQFNHSVGAGIVYGTGKLPAGAIDYGEVPTILGYGIFYHPRFNITESERSAIGIGIPLTFGLSGSTNSREGGNLSIIADLPLVVDYNFGAGSSVDNEDGFGAFIGAGFGYTYSNQTYTYDYGFGVTDYEQYKGTSYGPLAHGGIKAYINERVYFLRAFYKIGMEKQKFKTFGISVGVSL